MSQRDLAKVLQVLLAHEKRALGRARTAGSASIARSAAVQASGYTTRREAVQRLLSALPAVDSQPR